MPTRTLLQLRTEVLQRINTENADNFVTSAEVDRNINQSIKAWRDMIIENRGQEFFSDFTDLVLTGAGSYALPTDCYQLLSVTLVYGGEYTALRPYNMGDGASLANIKGNVPMRYRLTGGNMITIVPLQSTGYTLSITYVPHFTDLSADGDTVEVYNGWDEWFILDAAMKILEKENTDTSQLFVRKQEAEMRIIAQASFGDRGFPEGVTEVWDPDIDWYPY